MSGVELEHAAMAPRRWIELCNAALKNQPSTSFAPLRPRTTRFIEHPLAAGDYYPQLFIVPGGRYLVSNSPDGVLIWDLGYTSSVDCKLIASVGPEVGPEADRLEDTSFFYGVQATPDGMGLIIFSCPFRQCSIYEFYPQSETPQLTRIARLHLNPAEDPWSARLLPDRVLLYHFHGDSIIFKIWDYRMNNSISFSSDVGYDRFQCCQVITTESGIIFLCPDEMLVWGIPPLPPQSPDIFDCYPTHIPPLTRIAFPDGIQVRYPEFVPSQVVSPWYCGSSQPLYFDLLSRDAELYRFKIIVKPDLTDTSLHIVNTELVAGDFYRVQCGTYNICEDTFVACCGICGSDQFGVYVTPTSHGDPVVKVSLPTTRNGYNYFLCPASGRYVYLDSDVGGIFVVDLL